MKKPIIRIVTPEIASELLTHGRINNLMSRSKVEKYKKMMIAGKWKNYVGTPIVIKEGELLDGRHRLTAIAETGFSYKIPFEYA
jgi:hypothetical protein